MTSISLFDRIKTIVELTISKSFFITVFLILLLTAGLLIANAKIKSKVPKYIIAIIYGGLTILVLARYGQYVLSLNDSIVDKFFRAMYFPNVVVYLAMLIITILLLIYVILDEKFSLFTKIWNYASFFLIWFLFVLVVDTVKQNNLNFSEVTELYANTTVMVLLQASMGIFIIWISIVITDMVVRKLAIKMAQKESLNKDNLNKNNLPNKFFDKIKNVNIKEKTKDILNEFKKNKDI